MKEDIHPSFQPVIFHDSSSGFMFLSHSTKNSNETMQWEDGNSYPVIRVETSSASHPFYTGKQRNVEIGGRVSRFQKRLDSKQP